MCRFDDFFGSLRMCVGDKQLTEKLVIDHGYYFAYAGFVEFIKNIIEQYNRGEAEMFFQKMELRNF